MHVGTEVDIKDVNWTIYPHISWIDSDESAAGPVTLTQEWRWGREHLHDWFTPVDEKPKPIDMSDADLVNLAEREYYKLKGYALQHGIPLPSEKPKKIERIKHFLQSDAYIVDKLNEIIAFLNKE